MNFKGLILFELDIFDGHCAFVAVDGPAVALDAIDTLGISEHVVDIHYKHGVVGIDVDIIRSVRRNWERIAAATFEFPFALFFFETYIVIIAVGADHDAVVFLVGLVAVFAVAADEGDAETVGFVSGGDGHGYMVVVAEGVEHDGAISLH